MYSFNFRQLYLVIGVLSALFYKLMYVDFNLEGLCDLDKRPFIFGDELCASILNSDIETETSYASRIFALFGHKVIFKTRMSGDRVVLSKLGSNDDIESLDSVAVQTFGDDLSLLNDSFLQERILDALHNPDKDVVPKFHLCPEPVSMNKFMAPLNIQLSDVNSSLQVWTLLKLNPEPLIFQILTPPDWPVPRYRGSCGRLSVFEDCGEMLTAFHSYPWKFRANLSIQLISAAFQFTFGHPDFGFYLTDISAYNIVVDDGGKVTFIDLENIIVVDKNPSSIDELKYWHKNHTSYVFDCPDCFAYSTDDICSHRISDHNIFGVCKEIFSDSSVLPGGFLHSAPDEIAPFVKILIAECVNPSGISGRFEMAQDLQKILVQNL